LKSTESLFAHSCYPVTDHFYLLVLPTFNYGGNMHVHFTTSYTHNSLLFSAFILTIV